MRTRTVRMEQQGRLEFAGLSVVLPIASQPPGHGFDSGETSLSARPITPGPGVGALLMCWCANDLPSLWYDFLIGDGSRIAVGIAAALALAYGLSATTSRRGGCCPSLSQDASRAAVWA